MKIDSIELCNINTLYNLLSEIKDTDHKGVVFGRNMNNLLKHLSITMEVSDISLLEAYYLKQYCCGDFVLNNTKIDLLAEGPDNGPISTIIKAMDVDSDIEIKPGILFLQLNKIKCNCFISLSGSTLCNIFSTFPENFFRSLFTDLDNRVLLTHIKNEDLEKVNNKIIELFLKSFFKYCNEKSSYIDILSDYGIEKEYYKYGEIDTATLSTVQTIRGGFNLAARDTDDIGIQIDLIKEKLLELRKEDIINSTKLIYTCNSSLNAFLKLFLSINIDYFIDTEDIKKVISKDEYIFPSCFNKYKIRLNANIDELVEMKNKKLEELNGEMNFSKFGNLLLNSTINYSLKLSLTDIDIINSKLKNGEIIRNHEKNLFVSNEINKLIKDINDQKELVLKTFINN